MKRDLRVTDFATFNLKVEYTVIDKEYNDNMLLIR